MDKIGVDIQTVLQQANNLPALPGFVHEVLDMIESPDTTTKDFQDLIIQDPILVSRILKLANSAYYGYSHEIVTISEAIIIIGLDTLKSLVIAISAHIYLYRIFEGYRMKLGDMWKHSLFCAMISKLIVKNLYIQEVEKYFIGGLLHDIGKLLLNSYIAKYYQHIENYTQKNKVPYHVAEKNILGIDHSEVGAQLATLWRLPFFFSNVIRYHHNPDDGDNDDRLAASIIYASNIVTNKFGFSYGRNEGFVVEDKKIFAELNLNQDFINNITEQVKVEIEKFNKFFTAI